MGIRRGSAITPTHPSSSQAAALRVAEELEANRTIAKAAGAATIEDYLERKRQEFLARGAPKP